MSKHTPGPWKAEPPNEKAMRNTWSVWPQEGSGHARIATITQGDNEKANAELIAQAPDLKQQRDDLLAALKALKAYVDKEPCEYADPLGEADEAIARAEGKQ